MLYLLLFIVVLLLPFTLRIAADTKNDAVNLQADFMFLGLIPIKLFQKSITVKNVIASFFSGKKSKYSKARIFRAFRKHIKIKKLILNSHIGTGDAASTAIISGQVFGFLAPAVANLSKNQEYKLDINPVFDKKEFDFLGECILRTNMVHTVIAIFEILRSKKNGKASY